MVRILKVRHGKRSLCVDGTPDLLILVAEQYRNKPFFWTEHVRVNIPTIFFAAFPVTVVPVVGPPYR